MIRDYQNPTKDIANWTRKNQKGVGADGVTNEENVANQIHKEAPETANQTVIFAGVTPYSCGGERNCHRRCIAGLGPRLEPGSAAR